MGIAFGILALGGTEAEIHLGVIYPPPQLQRTFKTTSATLLGVFEMTFSRHFFFGEGASLNLP